MLVNFCSLLMLTQLIYVTYGKDTGSITGDVPNVLHSSSNNSTELKTNTKLGSIGLAEVFQSNTPPDLTHKGRENVSEVTVDKTIHTLEKLHDSNTNQSSTTEASNLKPIEEPVPQYDLSSEKNDGKSIVPKKGVIYENDTLNETQNTDQDQTLLTTNKMEPVTSMNMNSTKTVGSKSPKINNLKAEEKVISTSNLMLPVIGVVLSIPVIGILVIGFYKCGSEWWQHRHYRRMDFLIDGMYNN